MSQVTKRALEQSLKNLLLKKPLTKITINDIAEDCGINRMTFYYHFKDIYDLVEWSCLEDARRALEEKKTHDTWQQGLLQIFEAVRENKPFMLNVYHCVDREQVERYLRPLVDHLILGVIDEQSAALTVRMLKIALPLAVSAYARSALNTILHLLVPRGLRAAGYSADGALSGYGTIQGMVLPIILFPSCIMSAVAELIVPELTAAQVQQDGQTIRRTTRKLFSLSLMFSCAVGLFMFLFADKLGGAVYKSYDAGRYIRLLAPLVPVMYTDMTVDGCLKGLGQQVWSMGINILDSLLGLILVWLFLPRYALPAYIAMIYITETFNFLLSLQRLRSIVRECPSEPSAATRR